MPVCHDTLQTNAHISLKGLYKHIFKIKIYFSRMKTKQNLFFFVVISFFTFQTILGQNTSKKSIDSSSFYYKVLLKTENPKAYNNALKYYDNQYKKHLKNNHILKAANDLEIIANGEYNIGDFVESEKVLIKALELHKNSQSSISRDARKRIYSLLGVLYNNIKWYDKSLDLYSRSLNTAKNSRDSISIFLNISNVLREKDNFTKSIDTLKHALKLVKKSDNLYLKAYILDNLGFSEFLSNNKQGFQHLSESLQLREKLKDTIGLFSNYRHLSHYYKQNSRVEKANVFAKKALALSKEIKDPSYELEALNLLASLDNNKNTNRFQFLNDSIEKARQLKENKYAAMKYDVDKEKEQTQLALLQNAKEKQEKTVYLGLVILSIIIFSVIIYIILANRKKKQLETIFDTETRISKKLHDELANDTFQVMAQLQALPEIPEEIIDELDLIYSKTRNISRDHNPIYEHTDFYEQLKTMLAAYKSDDFNVIVKNDQKIEWETLNPLKKKTLYIVLKELMTNNRKHSRSNFALISFSQKGNKLNIAYKDNGIGGDLKKNNGLQNLEYRIKALKGKIDFDSEHGKGFKVDILL